MEAGWLAEESNTLLVPSEPKTKFLNRRIEIESKRKTFPAIVLASNKDEKQSYPEPGLKRRVLAYNDKLSLSATRTIRLCTLCGDISGSPARAKHTMFRRATVLSCGVAWNTARPHSMIRSS